jgi:hypothetical protein
MSKVKFLCLIRKMERYLKKSSEHCTMGLTRFDLGQEMF